VKFKVTFKDPDTLGDALHDAGRESASGVPGLSDDERRDLAESRRDQFAKICAQWFEYSEYLTVEVDTEEKTIRVCEVGEP
jgi:hypothetical protein